jgi:large subunit ribosomal protein L19
MKNSGIGQSLMVRKISYGVGVERVFPVNSPRVEKVEVIRAGKVRRAKLYYIRGKVGKKSKVKVLLPGAGYNVKKEEAAQETKA